MSRLHNTTGPCVAEVLTGDERVFRLRRPRKEWIDTPKGIRWFARIPVHGKPKEKRLKFFRTENECDAALDAYMKRGL